MAGQPRFEDLGGGRFRVAGDLGLATVTGALAASEPLFAGHPAVELDLAGVSGTDSATVALLIEWLARARAAGRSIRFRAAPPQLAVIARLSDVDELLSLG